MEKTKKQNEKTLYLGLSELEFLLGEVKKKLSVENPKPFAKLTLKTIKKEGNIELLSNSILLMEII